MHPAKPAPPGRRFAGLPPYLLVGLAVAVAFRATPFLGFVDYDDPLIVDNPAVNGGLTFAALRHAFAETSIHLWTPLTILSHALDFQIFGGWPGGHHLVNLALHLASCLILLAWLRRWSGDPALALAATLLFAVHPLRVESVAWVAERKDVLSVFFYLLAVWHYTIWAASRGGPADEGRGPEPLRRLRRHYWLAVLAALLGALSKPSLMTLPAALLLIDYWPLRRLSATDWKNWPLLGRLLFEKLPFAALAAAAAAVAWATWSETQFVGEPPSHSLVERIGFASMAYARYLALTFAPVGMVAFLPHPAEVPAWGYAAAGLLAAASVAVLWQHRRAPWLVFGWLWFLGTILPGSGLVTISDHFAPDRYTYLGHAGLSVALVWLVAATGRRHLAPRTAAVAGWAALALATLALSHFADRQTRVWRDPETLWSHALVHTPANYVAHNQLGLALLQRGEVEEGMLQLRASIAARPGFPVAIANLALAMARDGRMEEGRPLLDTLGQDFRDRGRFLSEMLAVALAKDDEDLAAELWREIVAAYPDSAGTRVAAGDFFYRRGEADAALRLYDEAVRIEPDNARAALSAATLLLQRGATAEALPYAQRAAEHARARNTGAEAWRTVAQSHILLEEWAEAIAAYKRALSISASHPVVRNEAAQLLLDCPDPSLRDPGGALHHAQRLPDAAPWRNIDPNRETSSRLSPPKKRTVEESPNPRYLRTLARAWQANGREDLAAEVANAGLDAVREITSVSPLPKPWTKDELDGLRSWFLNLLDGAEREAKADPRPRRKGR